MNTHKISIYSFLLLIVIYPSFIFSQGDPSWYIQQSGTVSALYSVFFTNVNTGWAVGAGGIIRATTNSGENWFPQTSNTTYSLYSITFKTPTAGWLSGAGGQIRRTTNAGNNWLSTSTGTLYTIYSLSFYNEVTGWACGYGGIVLKTTNNGINWVNQTSNTVNDLLSIFFINDSTGWASGNGGTMVRTSNGGTNWNILTSLPVTINQLYFINQNTGYAVGQLGYVFRTSNGGVNWMQQIIGSNNNRGCMFLNSYGFPQTGYLVGSGGLIRYTSNGGFDWFLQQTPTTQQLEKVYFINQLTGWAVGLNGVILRTINGGLTNIKSISEYAYQFKLNQNYPNPFNPETIISFSIPAVHNKNTQLVKLQVFDILGCEITTLINKEMPAGTYEIHWDGTNYPSGIYMYRLIVGNYSDTKSMILLR
jgi:photosystem II stability/assembly factor-like uncharacterized protein